MAVVAVLESPGCTLNIIEDAWLPIDFGSSFNMALGNGEQQNCNDYKTIKRLHSL